MVAKVHACTEARAEVWARTFCGVEVRKSSADDAWKSRAWRQLFVTRSPREVTCGRCERAMN